MKLRVRIEVLRVFAGLIVVCVATAGLHLIRIPGTGAPDFPCTKTAAASTEISILSGQAGSTIAQLLFDAGVVKSAEVYFRVAVGDARSTKVAPGIHRIDIGICAATALTQLLDSSRIGGLINIVEGMWVSEVLPQMYAAGFKKSEVLRALNSVVKPKSFSSIEGLLFPAQYSFAQGTTAAEALHTMILRATQELKTSGISIQQSSFSAQQLLIIASLIEAEGNTEDFAKISRVIRNRLAIGMPLQFDSTVHYIKKSRGSVFLSTQSTLISSPYNTYRRYGLPPGPINNPGAAAMRAAVTPAAGDWLYFITVAPFDTRFTKDIRQFNLWKIEYKKNLRDGKFRSGK